jgi:hypothetical protein
VEHESRYAEKCYSTKCLGTKYDHTSNGSEEEEGQKREYEYFNIAAWLRNKSLVSSELMIARTDALFNKLASMFPSIIKKLKISL